MLNMGTKRVCMFCTTKFYDFEKDPVICPKCGAPFDPNMMFKKRGKIKDQDLGVDNFEIEDDLDVAADDENVLDIVDDADDGVDIPSREDNSEGK